MRYPLAFPCWRRLLFALVPCIAITDHLRPMDELLARHKAQIGGRKALTMREQACFEIVKLSNYSLSYSLLIEIDYRQLPLAQDRETGMFLVSFPGGSVSRFIPIQRRGAELLSRPVYRLQLATKADSKASPVVPSIQTHFQSTACH